MTGIITVYGNSGASGNVLVRTITSVGEGGSGGGSGGVIVTPNPTDGSGTPGGSGNIGSGDGGFGTPADSTITRPSITFPNSGDNTNIAETDTVTSSVFAATGARTHLASRWIIAYVGAIGDAAPTGSTSVPTIIFDSGVDTVNKTSLPLSVTHLARASQFQVYVRYKASGGNWSDWSPQQNFYSSGCEAAVPVNPNSVTGMKVWYDASVSASITLVSSRVSAWADQSANVNNAAQANATIRGQVMTDQFAAGAIMFNGGTGVGDYQNYYLNLGTQVDLSTGGTIFMVGYWEPQPAFSTQYSFIGVSNGDVVNSAAIGVVGRLLSGSSQSGRMEATNALHTGQTDAEYTGDSSVTTGKHIFEFVIDPLPANSTMFMDGAAMAATYFGTGWSLKFNRIGSGGSSYLSRHNEMAEFIAFDNTLTAAKREGIRLFLANKWGITL